MSPGSRYKLWVPSKLAYGPNGQGSIQPDAALVVDVKLIAIKKVGVRP
jgi:FKBP-type peptidyl-prolyl cis-trans isomerase